MMVLTRAVADLDRAGMRVFVIIRLFAQLQAVLFDVPPARSHLKAWCEPGAAS